MDDPSHRLVLFVAYPGVGLLDLTGPFTVLWSASWFVNQRPDPTKQARPYERRFATVQGGPVSTTDGLTVIAEPLSSFDNVDIDTIIVPGALDMDAPLADHALIEWIATNARRARRVCSVCTGSFLLAEAGLLNGRRVVTHWGAIESMRAKYPSVHVEPDAIFVHDGKIWSSAGVSAGIDLALALVEEDCGRDVAMSVARQLVVYMRRPGGQSQFSELLDPNAGEPGAFSELHDWLTTHLDDTSLSVETLARRVCMSARNFARVYKTKTGRTPAKAIELFRLETARRMLEDTNERIESIARRTGFGDEDRMRNTFQRHLNVSPRDYRARFGARDVTHSHDSSSAAAT
jgi:transcriptional regulator GlxA family with amidase domain